MTVRARFAPSPTGFLHVGSARTALYNWLVVRSRGGSFVLRSDDTDQARNEARFYDDIIDGLRWLGLDWDEGVEAGGEFGPYRQSERLHRYGEAAALLVDTGNAYRCFCTAAELEDRRREAMAGGRPPGYDGRCRTIDAVEARRRAETGELASIRLAVPRPGRTTFTDVVRGDVTFDHANVDDLVIVRSNGFPTYHLASSVDDDDFRITHVIRGEDLLSSTPKHILIRAALHRAAGVDDRPPIVYAHLSLLMGPDGKKLSKRHGDTAVAAYRDAGYLPEAMVNYLALLGWSPGDDETVIGVDEMVARFDLADVSKNPAIFDVDKLQWLNGVYIRDLPAAEFVARSVPFVEARLGRVLGASERDRFEQIAPLVQERVKLLGEVSDQVRFLFVEDVEYDEASWSKVMKSAEARVPLAAALARLDALGEWSSGSVEETLRMMLDEHGLSARSGLQPLRVALTGSSVSPPLFESIEALGRTRTLQRLGDALARL